MVQETRLATGRPTLLVLGLAVLVAATLVLWFLVRGSGEGSPVKAGSGPVLLSLSQLERFARSADGPVYWAGPRNGAAYEVTTTTSGRTFVRYLPPGVSAGDPRADFLVVGTYAQPHAFADLRRAAARPRTRSFRTDHDGLVVYSSARPTNVYAAYPGRKDQIEIYDPSASKALNLFVAGKIVPVG
jgi:hypothetical protein